MLLFFLAQAHAQNAVPTTFHFGGQYRLNLFSDVPLENDAEVALGERLRLRPTVTFELPSEVRGMLQVEANQVDNAPVFRARYADFSVRAGEARVHAGFLPLSDEFGDTLFSASWDFNPLAVAVTSEEGDWKGRLAAGWIFQGPVTTLPQDDVVLALGDIDRGRLGASVVVVSGGPEALAAPSTTLIVPGVRILPVQGDVKLTLNLLGSVLLGSGELRSVGEATRAELALPVGEGTLSVLGVYATGGGLEEDSVGHAFFTPMSLFGFHGYWGYTGRLTVQGPTDQGIDDPYNIDGGTYDGTNLGQGMASGQVKLGYPLSEEVGVAGSSGVFVRGEGGLYGVDNLAQLTWKVEPEVSVNLCAAFTAFGGEHHARADTLALALASRLQLEF